MLIWGVIHNLATIIFKPTVISEEVGYWFTSWFVLAGQQKAVAAQAASHTVMILKVLAANMISLKPIL